MKLNFIKSNISSNEAYLFTTLNENKFILLMPNSGYGFKNFLLYYEKDKQIIHLQDRDDIEGTSAMNSITFIATCIVQCSIFKNTEKIIFYFKDFDSKIKNRIFDLKNMQLTNIEEKNDIYEEFTK